MRFVYCSFHTESLKLAVWFTLPASLGMDQAHFKGSVAPMASKCHTEHHSFLNGEGHDPKTSHEPTSDTLN